MCKCNLISQFFKQYKENRAKIKRLKRQIKQFKKETGFELRIEEGKPHYNGYLDLAYKNITALPDNLIVNGILDLYHASISSLPNGLVVSGIIDLRYTNITELPNDIIVGGSLNLGYTKIAKLPDNLIIGNNLYLNETKITKLPDNIVIGGNLYVDEAEETKPHKCPKILSWNNWEYIRFEGLFSKVLYRENNIIEIQPFYQNDNVLISYIVIDEDNEKYGYGSTVEEAKIDLWRNENEKYA